MDLEGGMFFIERFGRTPGRWRKSWMEFSMSQLPTNRTGYVD
jgi:hypothetical protein